MDPLLLLVIADFLLLCGGLGILVSVSVVISRRKRVIC